MNIVALNQNVFTVSVPSIDTKRFKQLIKLMGWTAVPSKSTARLFDPETGEYLNDETMQAIEDVRNGKEPVYTMKSMDEFKAWCEGL